MLPAVFLDRDGTLVEEAGYVDRVDRLRLFPWSVDAVRSLSQAGLSVVVISNQAGVARGLFTEDVVAMLHRHLAERLAAGGARVERFYYCPHHPDAPVAAYRRQCECRKPRPGMLHRAAEELGLELARSFVVGDRWLDVEAAQAVGARGILVRTGYGETEVGRPPAHVRPAHVAANLIEAATWILREHARWS